MEFCRTDKVDLFSEITSNVFSAQVKGKEIFIQFKLMQSKIEFANWDRMRIFLYSKQDVMEMVHLHRSTVTLSDVTITLFITVLHKDPG